MKWPAGARKGNRSSCCHGSRCIATLGIINDTKITTHLYPIGFSGVGVGSSEWAPFYTISHFFVVSLFFSSNYERTTQDNLHVLQTTLLCWIYVRHGNILHWISKAPLSPIPLFFIALPLSLIFSSSAPSAAKWHNCSAHLTLMPCCTHLVYQGSVAQRVCGANLNHIGWAHLWKQMSTGAGMLFLFRSENPGMEFFSSYTPSTLLCI